MKTPNQKYITAHRLILQFNGKPGGGSALRQLKWKIEEINESIGKLEGNPQIKLDREEFNPKDDLTYES